jgi:hypothetical protein
MPTPAGLLKGGEDAFGVVLGTQWPNHRRPTGAGALALAVLVSAARDAGFTAISSTHTRPRQRAVALSYLAGRGDGSEPLPLETACALVGLNVDRVRRAVLRRLGPGDAP